MVRSAYQISNGRGVRVLQQGPTRPHRTQVAFRVSQMERLRKILAAKVSFEQGLTASRVSDETVRLSGEVGASQR